VAAAKPKTGKPAAKLSRPGKQTGKMLPETTGNPLSV
jgi:hypothetical protein